MDPKDIHGVRDGNESTYAMSANPDQLLIEKVKALPADRRAEVEDFVDFLQGRVADRRLVDAATRASAAAFSDVWDNDQDSAYDRL